MLQRNLLRFGSARLRLPTDPTLLRIKPLLPIKSAIHVTKGLFHRNVFLAYNRVSFFSTLSPQEKHKQQVQEEEEEEEEEEDEGEEGFKRILISNPKEIKPRKVLTDIYVQSKMTVGDFKKILPLSEEEIENSMIGLGIPNDPNFQIEYEQIELFAYENNLAPVFKKQDHEQPLRPPIITIMGHVDHGKTTLLDAFRNSNIAEGEYGGITQKIGAFMVKTQEGKIITFIDTPGHEAFTNMRRRGSLCTDMVILVVSVTDGCQPQTFEAIEHAKNAGVPIIVAVNKIDKGGNPEEIEKELFDYGLNLESHGGNVPVIHISAKTKQNIDLLEELILFEAEVMDLRADKDAPAEGVVLETKRNTDTETKACTVVVQKGTLKVGDFVVAGTQYGRIRLIKDDRGNSLNEAPPSSAIEIVGLKDFPENGDAVFAVANGEKAKAIAARRKIKKESMKELEPLIQGTKVKFSNWRQRRKFHSGAKGVIQEVLEESETKLLEKIKALQEDKENDHTEELQKLQEELQAHYKYVKQMVEGPQRDSMLNIILKAQDKGTLETLVEQINKIAAKQQSELNFNILSSSVGNISEAEIWDARNFNAVIFGMDVTCSADLIMLAQAEKVQVKTYKIIYDILDELQSIFKRGGVSKPETVVHGSGVIKQVFEVKLGKGVAKKVAGLAVNSGQFTRKYKYKVVRNGKTVKDNLGISSLKSHKTEVNEIKKGKECGLSLFEFDDFQEGDVLEAYEIVKGGDTKS